MDFSATGIILIGFLVRLVIIGVLAALLSLMLRTAKNQTADLNHLKRIMIAPAGMVIHNAVGRFDAFVQFINKLLSCRQCCRTTKGRRTESRTRESRWCRITFESVLHAIPGIYSHSNEQQCRNIAPATEVDLIGIAKPNGFEMMQRVR